MWDYFRLVLAILLLALALMAWLKAPNIPAWMLALGATEFGHWFAFAPLLLIGFGRLDPPSLAGTGVAVFAIGFFYSTAFRAAIYARRLPGDLQAAFGLGAISGEPFNGWKLFFGNGERRICPEVMNYREGTDYCLRLNFFRSVKVDKLAPCVVVLHTGGWNSGTPDEFAAFNSHLAHQGYAVAALEYRLAPKWQWPSPREDVKTALAFLKSRRAELNLDPERMVLLGRSAGGHIAETVAYSLNDPTIRGCIAFYAPADMHFAYQFGREDDMLKSLAMVRSFMGGSPTERPEAYDSATALQLISPLTPPTLLFHGTPDPLVWVRQSERLAAALNQAGVPHLLVELPWATHAFDFNFCGPGGQLSTYAVDAFLAACLSPQTSGPIPELKDDGISQNRGKSGSPRKK